MVTKQQKKKAPTIAKSEGVASSAPSAEALGGAGRAASYAGDVPVKPVKARWVVESDARGGTRVGGLTVAGQTLFAPGDVYKGKRPKTKEWPKQAVLTALDVATGAARWSFKATPESFALSQVTVRDGVVFLGTTLGLHAFDAHTGELKWFAKDETRLVRRPLAVVDDQVITPVDDGLAGFDRATGARRWKLKDAALSQFGGPFSSLDGLLFVSAEEPERNDRRSHAVVALDVRATKTPEVVWRAPTFHDGDDGPIVVGSRLYFWENPGLRSQIKLQAVDARSGKSLWSRAFADDGPSPGLAANAEHVVVSLQGGALLSLDASSGTQRWQSASGGALDPGIGRFCLGDGAVFAVRRQGGASVVAAVDAATGTALWKVPPPEGHEPWSAWGPTLHDGVLYLQTLTGVVALGA